MKIRRHRRARSTGAGTRRRELFDRKGPSTRVLRLEPLEERTLLAVLFVDADATGAGSGQNWGDAFVEIQPALDLAEVMNADADVDNDITEIWIADGPYRPTKRSVSGTSRTETFQLLDNVALVGGFAGTEAAADERVQAEDGSLVAETVLVGDLLGNDDPGNASTYDDNAYTVVLAKGLSHGALLDGLTITGGRATEYDSAHPEYRLGGAIYSASTLTITDSTISDNSARNGGGIYYSGGGTLTVTDSTISDNSALDGGGGGIYSGDGALTIADSVVLGNSAIYGGGIYYYHDDFWSREKLTVTNSTIAGNSADRGGGIYYRYSADGNSTITSSSVSNNSASGDGGGIYCDDYYRNGYALTVTDSSITDNSAVNNGGGIYNARDSSMQVINSTVSGNSAREGGGISNDYYASMWVTNSTVLGNSARHGGGVHSNYRLTVTNSTVSGNSANDDGGGIWNRDTLTVTNSTVSGNSANDDGAGIWNSDTLTVTNSTVSGNSANDEGGGIHNEEGNLTVANSIVTLNAASSGPDIQGRVSSGGFNIIGLNPWFARNPSPGTDGIWGTDDDDHGDLHLMARSPAINLGSSSAGLATDLDGQPRVYGGRVDIGAYEYQDTPQSGREIASPIVTTLDDTVDFYDGEISLREALFLVGVEAITGPITFDAVLDGGEVTLESSTLSVDYSVQVDASSLSSLIINADHKSRVFTILVGDVELVGLTVTGGSAGDGGGIACFNGTLTVASSTVTGNSANGDGGGIWNSRFSTLTVINSTVSGNSADDDGGGIFSWGTVTVTNSTVSGNSAGGGYGGGIYNDSSYHSGTLMVTNSTISDNSARGGGGIYNDSYLNGTLTVTDSTIFGNSAASASGGGILVIGRGTVTVTNSAVSGNSANDDGGGVWNSDTLTVTNSTISGNSANDDGGGIKNSGTLTVTNSAVSGNSANDDGGGVWNADTLTVINSTVSGNSANGDGGGAL